MGPGEAGDLRLLVPDAASAAELEPLTPGVDIQVWNVDSSVEPPRANALFLTRPGDAARMPRLRTIRSLRLVQMVSLGYDWVTPHIPDGVALSNGVGTCESSAAETAMSLILASLKGFARASADRQAKRWQSYNVETIDNAVILLLGVGGVGARLGQYLKAFGPRELIQVGRRARLAEDGSIVYGVSRLPQLLPRADVVVVSLPLNSSTRGIVDSQFLALMRDGAHLVNVGRGELVDTAALLNELNTARLFAGLDVVDPEPLPHDHPLWTAENLVFTPHVGGNTAIHRTRGMQLISMQLRRLASGEPLANVVHYLPGPQAPTNSSPTSTASKHTYN